MWWFVYEIRLGKYWFYKIDLEWDLRIRFGDLDGFLSGGNLIIFGVDFGWCLRFSGIEY
jgi:hypothetical protein